LGDPAVLDYLSKTRPVFDVNALAAVAGIAALSDTEHLEASRAQAAEARDLYVERLTALGLTPYPSETNFIAVPLPAGVSDAAVVAAMAARGIAINALGAWGLPGVLRISFGTPAENILCLDALRDILATQ
jgi:histidinol-phosphate aminotransferase